MPCHGRAHRNSSDRWAGIDCRRTDDRERIGWSGRAVGRGEPSSDPRRRRDAAIRTRHAPRRWTGASAGGTGGRPPGGPTGDFDPTQSPDARHAARPLGNDNGVLAVTEVAPGDGATDVAVDARMVLASLACTAHRDGH